jgi:hypothetical protein
MGRVQRFYTGLNNQGVAIYSFSRLYMGYSTKMPVNKGKWKNGKES